MESKVAATIFVMFLAVAMAIPMMDTDAADSEVFRYYSELDGNGKAVYSAVSSLNTVTETEITFSVDFTDIDLRLFNDSADAKAYAVSTVKNALAAVYLSCPMVPYIWDYPVTGVEVESELGTSTIEGAETVYYEVVSVSFKLAVPEGITAESMKSLNDAIADVKVTGNTDSDKVISIISYLSGVRFLKDEEGKISNIYNALVDKKATSAGISQAFNKLCEDNGIKAISVAGNNEFAADEEISVWNNVNLKGDLDGETVMQWFIVDPLYCASYGITGYLTDVGKDNAYYSMSSAHYINLDKIGENDLPTPQLAKGKYVREGGLNFLELYGDKIMIAAIGVVTVAALVYALRAKNV